MATIAAISERNDFINSESRISKQNDYSYSEFSCRPNASPSLASIRLNVREQMWFEYFQDGHNVGHLGYRNEMNLAILNLHVFPMPPAKFRLKLTCGFGGYVVEEFRHGVHLGYRNETIIAILCIHVAPMPPTKFGLNPTFNVRRGRMTDNRLRHKLIWSK